MRSLLALSATGLFTAAVLVACGDDSATPAASPEPTPDGGEAGADRPVLDAGLDSASDGRAPYDGAAPAITCAVTPCITAIVAGPRSYCATANDGTVRCWGDPSALGSFVNGDDPNAGATPVALTGLSGIVDIGITYSRTCVTLADGSVDCFGSSSPTPTPVSGISNAAKLAVGELRSCAVLKTGELFCWGDSWQMGSGPATLRLGDEAASDAVIDQSVALAITTGGVLYSWGADRALLGRDTPFTADLTPTPVLDIPAVSQIVTSNGSSLALARDGRLFGWGRNSNGGLGLGSFLGPLTPTEVRFASTAWPSQIALGITHSCARMTDGTLFCCGAKNHWGQLGYDALPGVYVPTAVRGLKHAIASVAVGMFSTCALSVDGSVQCWGDNSYGQLGLGTRDTLRHTSPTTVDFH